MQRSAVPPKPSASSTCSARLPPALPNRKTAQCYGTRRRRCRAPCRCRCCWTTQRHSPDSGAADAFIPLLLAIGPVGHQAVERVRVPPLVLWPAATDGQSGAAVLTAGSSDIDQAATIASVAERQATPSRQPAIGGWCAGTRRWPCPHGSRPAAGCSGASLEPVAHPACRHSSSTAHSQHRVFGRAVRQDRVGPPDETERGTMAIATRGMPSRHRPVRVRRNRPQ